MRKNMPPPRVPEIEARTIAAALIYCEKRLRDNAALVRVSTGAHVNKVASINALADRMAKLAGVVYSMCPWYGGYLDGNEIAAALGEDWE